MVSYKEALEIARKKLPDLNFCVEYDTAYTFSREYNDGITRHGGYGAPLAVIKETGEVLPMIRFATKYRSNEIRSFKVEE